jgi:hypothetical protein
MENKKMTPAITTKAASGKGGKHAEGIAHDDERAALVRSSLMPSFMQRKTVATEDEEKKEKEAKIARMHAGGVRGPEKKL